MPGVNREMVSSTTVCPLESQSNATLCSPPISTSELNTLRMTLITKCPNTGLHKRYMTYTSTGITFVDFTTKLKKISYFVMFRVIYEEMNLTAGWKILMKLHQQIYISTTRTQTIQRMNTKYRSVTGRGQVCSINHSTSAA